MQIPKISLWLGVLTLGVALNVQAADNADQAAARAALEAKMKELDAQPPEPPPQPPVATPVPPAHSGEVVMKPIKKDPPPTKVTTPKVTSPEVAVTPPPTKVAVVPPPTTTPVATVAPVAPVAPVQPKSPVNSAYVGMSLGLRPIAAPALPITPGQQTQLDALLAKYQADQVTPDEYHKARAAILATP